MIIFKSIILGLVQGITEFLPVSSSGHLIVMHNFFNFTLADELFFDVMLHMGTLVALFLFFYRDIYFLIKGFFESLTNWNLSNDNNQKMAWLIILASVPAFIVGYFFNDWIDNYFRDIRVVVFMLVLVSFIFFITERFAKSNKDRSDMNRIDALIIGMAQVLAFIPGTSRSGITIVGGMFRGLKRAEAAKFSFLLSAPVIFGAGAHQILGAGAYQGSYIVLVSGFLAAMISGYLSIKLLLKFLENYSLRSFAWYRILLALVIFVFLLF